MSKRGPHHDNITWTPHIRIAWGGSIGTGKEIWTNSMKYVPAAGALATEAQLSAADLPVIQALGRWVSVSAPNPSFIGQDANLSWLKMNNILASGLQATQATHIYEVGGGYNGYDANSVPFYQTFAITLRTALKRGRAHSGRLFPPCVQPPIVAGTGMCSVGDATAMALSFQVCLTSMQTALVAAGIPGGFAICSPGDATKGTVPIHTGITGVVVDQVPDVQHRRTDRLPRSEGATSAFAGG
jgi:hypothetical protein